MRLKNIITFALIIFVFLLHNMDTVKLMLKAASVNTSQTFANFPTEEEEEHKESKPSKKGKGTFMDGLFLEQDLISDSYLSRIGSNQNQNFSSSDYSLEIYSPPDRA